MKKILGIAVIATAMFFSASNVNNSSSDITLDSLINMNIANAQGGESGTGEGKYTRYISATLECFKVDWQGNIRSNGTYISCTSFKTDDDNEGLASCTSTVCKD